ncbi:MAG: sigma 54-interacting transcriptional regulator [Gemmataceae bacterium]|nr:sigma 54-interacting transcriptional regulator [Gemmataceae bacterium]
MAPHGRFVLAGNDVRLMQDAQRHLKPATSIRFDALSDCVGPESRTPVLLLATAADAAAVRAFVRESRLQKLRCPILILEAGAKDLADLDPFVSGRRAWPVQAEVVVRWIEANAPDGTPAGAEPLREEISRRLLRQTPSLAPLVDSLALAAAHPVTVLVDGETGTGKTFIGRLLHDFSPRREERFVVVPCGALAPNLVESEFFGHVKGAFTGADTAKVGKFAVAGDGSILLDEIDALGLEQQANLLRVIETGEFEPVGSNDTQHCTARIIAATNCNLEEAVDQGRFRRDLYYRLNVMPFYLPPLRDRIDDIAPLTRGMAARFTTRFRKDLFEINNDVIAVLEAFPWPGNIRQLENVVQQAVLVSNGPELQVAHLSPMVQEYFLERSELPRGRRLSLARRREESERATVERALEEASHSRTRAAQLLGVSRVTLYKKMRKYGLLKGSPSVDRGRDEPPRLRAVNA